MGTAIDRGDGDRNADTGATDQFRHQRDQPAGSGAAQEPGELAAADAGRIRGAIGADGRGDFASILAIFVVTLRRSVREQQWMLSNDFHRHQHLYMVPLRSSK